MYFDAYQSKWILNYELEWFSSDPFDPSVLETRTRQMTSSMAKHNEALSMFFQSKLLIMIVFISLHTACFIGYKASLILCMCWYVSVQNFIG